MVAKVSDKARFCCKQTTDSERPNAPDVHSRAVCTSWNLLAKEGQIIRVERTCMIPVLVFYS